MTRPAFVLLLLSPVLSGADFSQVAGPASSPVPVATVQQSAFVSKASDFERVIDVRGGRNEIKNFSSLKILCRNEEDVLALPNITVYVGDSSCISSAAECVQLKLGKCFRVARGQIAGPLLSVARECLAQGKTSNEEFGICVMPTVLKHCDTSGCSSCPSSDNATFNSQCTSSGGQLCKHTSVLFKHPVRMMTLCFPSVCSSQLLSTSLAKAYAGVVRRTQGPYKALNRPEFIDNEISCGSGAQRRIAHSSSPENVWSGSNSRSLQTWSHAALHVVAVAAVSLEVISHIF